MIVSKAFDNGLICGAEQHLVVDASVADELRAELAEHGAVVLDGAGDRAVHGRGVRGRRRPEDVVRRPVGGQDRRGRRASTARTRSSSCSRPTRPTRRARRRASGSPRCCRSSRSTATTRRFALCLSLLDYEGAGHTANIHTADPARSSGSRRRCPPAACWSTPASAHGCCGLTTGLPHTLTLGLRHVGRQLDDQQRDAHRPAQRQAARAAAAPAGGLSDDHRAGARRRRRARRLRGGRALGAAARARGARASGPRCTWDVRRRDQRGVPGGAAAPAGDRGGRASSSTLWSDAAQGRGDPPDPAAPGPLAVAALRGRAAVGAGRAAASPCSTPSRCAATLGALDRLGPARARTSTTGWSTRSAVVATSARTGPQRRVRRRARARSAHHRSHAVAYVPARDRDGARAARRPRSRCCSRRSRSTTPSHARGWYVDGGTRLNTPIKPALDLGAERLVVVASDSIAGPVMEPGERRRRARPTSATACCTCSRARSSTR